MTPRGRARRAAPRRERTGPECPRNVMTFASLPGAGGEDSSERAVAPSSPSVQCEQGSRGIRHFGQEASPSDCRWRVARGSTIENTSLMLAAQSMAAESISSIECWPNDTTARPSLIEFDRAAARGAASSGRRVAEFSKNEFEYASTDAITVRLSGEKRKAQRRPRTKAMTGTGDGPGTRRARSAPCLPGPRTPRRSSNGSGPPAVSSTARARSAMPACKRAQKSRQERRVAPLLAVTGVLPAITPPKSRRP